MEKPDSTAKILADALWAKYMTETDPAKRRHYGMRYAVWADFRDKETEDEELSDS